MLACGDNLLTADAIARPPREERRLLLESDVRIGVKLCEY